jgi:hypothetical protein
MLIQFSIVCGDFSKSSAKDLYDNSLGKLMN